MNWDDRNTDNLSMNWDDRNTDETDKEEDSFASLKKTDKARIGRASLCIGLKCI
jgi:hypothetical protein